MAITKMIVRLREDGRLEIPNELLTRHDWRPGTEVEVVDKGDELVVRRKTQVPQWQANPHDDDDLPFDQFLERHEGAADAGLTTDEIMEMTRGED